MVTAIQIIYMDKENEKISIGFAALLCFLFSIIVNPAYLFPPLRQLHLQELFAFLALAGCLFRITFFGLRNTFGKAELWYSLFILFAGISLLQIQDRYLFAEGVGLYQDALKALVIFLAMALYLSSFYYFKVGFFVFLFSVFLFELHGIKAVLSGGGLYAGRFASWIGQVSNSDEIGAFLVMILPVVLEILLYVKNKLVKIFLLCSALGLVLLMVLTQTRAAFLSLIIIAPLWAFQRNKFRLRMVMVGAAVIMMFTAGMYMTSSTEYSSYFDRMKTIFSTSSHEEDSNIKSRFMFWEEGVMIWKKFPLLGCGRGGMDAHETLTRTDIGKAYTQGLSLTRMSLHQSFIQTLAEQGIIGFSFFMLFLFATWKNSSRAIFYLKESPDHAFFYAVTKGLRITFYVYLINAMFTTITWSWLIIIFAGFLSSLARVSGRELEVKELEEEKRGSL